LIDPQRAGFVTSGVSIITASRGPDKAPVIARAAGCRVSRDGSRITLLVSASQGEALLEAVRATGAIGAVFSQPSTHRTIQMKGEDAAVAALEPGDAELLARYADAFAAEVGPFGFSEALARALVWAPEGDFAAVSFTPTSAFDQTPGPRAGTRLER
jgi:hypothetical protein